MILQWSRGGGLETVLQLQAEVLDGNDISRWRKANRMKQNALAEMLSVSQSTISKWERGTTPIPKVARVRLNEVMSSMHLGRLAAELACIQHQQQPKLLARGRDLQIIGVSNGFKSLWPRMTTFIGESTRDMLINEAESYREEHDYFREAEDGELLMVTAVSNRLISVGGEVEAQRRVRWHAIIRHIDGELVHELVYEPCAAGAAVGIETILRRSDVLRNGGGVYDQHSPSGAPTNVKIA